MRRAAWVALFVVAFWSGFQGSSSWRHVQSERAGMAWADDGHQDESDPSGRDDREDGHTLRRVEDDVTQTTPVIKAAPSSSIDTSTVSVTGPETTRSHAESGSSRPGDPPAPSSPKHRAAERTARSGGSWPLSALAERLRQQVPVLADDPPKRALELEPLIVAALVAILLIGSLFAAGFWAQRRMLRT
jgi:hypothetical protein